MNADTAPAPATRSASLFMFPRRVSMYSPAFWRLAFEPMQNVHVLCEQGSLAVVLGHRRLLNITRVEYLIMREDGSEEWMPASALRATNFTLRSIHGGRYVPDEVTA